MTFSNNASLIYQQSILFSQIFFSSSLDGNYNLKSNNQLLFSVQLSKDISISKAPKILDKSNKAQITKDGGHNWQEQTTPENEKVDLI